MHRKVVLQGPSTLVVSLPSTWTKENQVSRGDTLSVNPKGNSLIVSTMETKCGKNIVMDFDGTDQLSIYHNLRFLYRSGVDSIEIRYKENMTPETYYKPVTVMHAVQIELNRLMGMEIIDQSTNSCIIKCMVKEDQKDFDIFFRKIFHVMKIALDSFCSKTLNTEEGYIEIKEYHDTITRFISYCHRLLNKYGYKIHDHTIFYRQLLESLELLIDTLEEAAKNIWRLERKPSQAIKPYLEKINKHFSDLEEIIFKFNIQKVHLAHKNRDAILILGKAGKNFNDDDYFIIGAFQIMVAVSFRSMLCVTQSMKLNVIEN